MDRQRTVFKGFYKMKRFYIFTVFIMLFIAVGIIYYFDAPANNYVSLSKAEISQFIKSRNIEPLAIQNIQNETATVVLVDGGVYFLSKVSKSGEITENSTRWGVSQNEVDFGAQTTGNPYVYLILNDKEMIKIAYKVEVRFDDGKSISTLVQGKRGVLLFYNKNAENLTIESFEFYIYDKDGNILFENKG